MRCASTSRHLKLLLLQCVLTSALQLTSAATSVALLANPGPQKCKVFTSESRRPDEFHCNHPLGETQNKVVHERRRTRPHPPANPPDKAGTVALPGHLANLQPNRTLHSLLATRHALSSSRQQDGVLDSLPADDDDGGGGGGAPGRPFLIPLLPFGLSNQVLALKETLALAVVLNWTVVALGFWPHASELAAAGGHTVEPGGLRGSRRRLAISYGSVRPPTLTETRMDEVRRRDRAGAATAAAAAAEGPDLGRHGQPRRWLSQLQHLQLQLLQQPQGAGQRRPGKGTQQQGQQQKQHLGASAIIPFDLVFDRSGLAPLVRVVSGEEAVRQYGWSESGRADVLISISPTSGLDAAAEKVADAGLLDVSGVRTVRNHGFSCDGEGLSWMTRAAAGHRWVALYGYRRVVPAARSSYRRFTADSSPCARAYHQVSRLLSKSPLIKATARSFLEGALARLRGQQQQQQPVEDGTFAAGAAVGRQQQQRRWRGQPQTQPVGSGDAASGSLAGAGSSGGSNGGSDAVLSYNYIALHVRPYPDTCFEYFVRMQDFDAAAAAKVCRNPRLLLRMVPLVRQLLQADAAAADSASGPAMVLPPSPPAAVFVMSHPRIREVLGRELRRLWAPASPPVPDNTSTARGAAGEGGGGGGGPTPAPPPLPRLLFLSLAALPPSLRSHVAAVSLLSLVEQEVCRGALHFVGTKASSISVLVAQERVAEEEVEGHVRQQVQAEGRPDFGASGGNRRRREGRPGGDGIEGDGEAARVTLLL